MRLVWYEDVSKIPRRRLLKQNKMYSQRLSLAHAILRDHKGAGHLLVHILVLITLDNNELCLLNLESLTLAFCGKIDHLPLLHRGYASFISVLFALDPLLRLL